MQRLRGLDAAFVGLDRDTAPMQVAMTCLFDPSHAPGGFSFARARERVAQRIHLIAPFRRRLMLVPGQLHRPVWIDDPDFDLDQHLHWTRVTAPGGPRELAELTARLIARRLDPARPLWEMHYIDGLDGGLVATVITMHHACIDGISGVELAANLLDASPEPPNASIPPPWSPEAAPSSLTLLRQATRDLLSQPTLTLSVITRSIVAALRLRHHNRQTHTTAPPGPLDAPKICCNAPLTPRRQVEFAHVALGDVKHLKNATGTTVNDVVLAVVAGALRDHLQEHDALPTRPLVAAVPISTRDPTQPTITNDLSITLVDLATSIEDPLTRLQTISAHAHAAKDQDQRLGRNAIANLATITPPALLSAITALDSRANLSKHLPALCNVIVSNFPGTPQQLYFAGSPLIAAYPLGPLAINTGVNITVQSYNNTLWFGIVACPDTTPAPSELPTRLNDALQELTQSSPR